MADVADTLDGPALAAEGGAAPRTGRGPRPPIGSEAPLVLPVDDEPTGRGPLPILAESVEDIRLWEPPKHERRVRLMVLGMACLIFLPNLGAFGLWDPWETHYGAVTSEMLDTYDWISPWWGYREQIGSKEKQGKYFYSKPVFIFWTEAFTARIIGRGEWAVRLPVAMLAILSTFLAYLLLSKVWSRRAGLLGATVLATSPQFYMISRQAQTDMPFVGMMFCAMVFFALAVFGPRQRMTARQFRRYTLWTLGFLLLTTLWQYGILIVDLDDPVPEKYTGMRAVLWSLGNKGWAHALYYSLALGGILWWYAAMWRRERAAEGGAEPSDLFKDRWTRRFLLVLFYIFLAHATYAKGLLGFLLPGAIILWWLIVSWNWRMLARAELIRGIGIFLCVGLPWYVAMLTRHGLPYWNRFFVHDHFKRLGSGVHQIDSGTFEHFIKWLGIGLFPWVIFAPLALFWLIRIRARDQSARAQAKLFFAVWFLIAFALFTASSTKFHHYIFPAMPALAVITTLFILHVYDRGRWLARMVTVIGAVLFFAVGWDIHEDPQHLRNLMTYKYDRPLPEHLPIDADAPVSKTATTTWADSTFYKHTGPILQGILQVGAFEYKSWIRFILIAGLVMLALFFFAKTRKSSLVGLALLAAMMAAWSLNYYMPSLTPHWSQKYLFDSYYDTCTLRKPADYVEDAYEPVVSMLGLTFLADHFRSEPKRVCEEDVLAWLITWRGETYYSYNELKPIEKKEEQWMPYLETMNEGRKFYMLTERGKHTSIKSELKTATRTLKAKGTAGWTDIDDWDVRVENDENRFFQMISATPIRK